MIRRSTTCLTAAMVLFAVAAMPAQRSAPHATVVYAVGKEPLMPIPLLSKNEQQNEDVADQLFLHLVAFGIPGKIGGDDAFRPALAKSWHRTDSLTLVFDLDPRARWQDGVPVTSHDVVYTWSLATNPAIGADQARIEPIASVDAVNDRSVRVRFKRAFPEQVYTFGFLIQPLPAHLLEKIAPAAISTSEFVRHPIGDGPFRFERRVPGQLVELRADSTFFLGRPTIARFMVQYIEDPNARLNAFLTGTSDVYDAITPPALEQIKQHADVSLINVTSNDLVFLLFNSRTRTDSSKPNPFLSDPRVREALTLALDRPSIATTTFGPGTPVPDAAESQIWSWITGGSITSTAMNIAKAKTLLAQAGWVDANGDGVLDKNGVPLHFNMIFLASSAFRNAIGLRVQQAWRAVGVQADLEKVEGATFRGRVEGGQWDVLIHRVGQDPTPTSLVQSWSCQASRGAGTNYGRWCDTTFDRLVGAAANARNQPNAWRAALNRMTSQHPAAFLAAPSQQVAVHKRYENVVIWPTHPWLSVWQWRVRPEAALARDR